MDKRWSYNHHISTVEFLLLLRWHLLYWIRALVPSVVSCPDPSLAQNLTDHWLRTPEGINEMACSRLAKPDNNTMVSQVNNISAGDTLEEMSKVAQIYPDSKVHRAKMRPTWGRQAPGGPHVGPMNFAIWDNPVALNIHCNRLFAILNLHFFLEISNHVIDLSQNDLITYWNTYYSVTIL